MTTRFQAARIHTTKNHATARSLALLLGCWLGLAAFAQADDAAPAGSAEGAVEAVIRSLQEHWNRGDMTGYLARYEESERLRLTFGNTIVEGWDALDSLFRASYPDPERMGRFSIDRIETRQIGDDTAMALGNFTHVFPHETIHGGFTHVLRRDGSGQWIIIHERTSRGEVVATD